jgi:phosphoribosylaminoimidazole-succinocarboxamide synthase
MEYCRTGSVCGHTLPKELTEADRLPEPIFTPSTKAAPGAHDENITFEQAANLVGLTMLEKVRDISLQLYAFASAFALRRGIIIADTKFEFGVIDGELMVIDELFTPDSSRFWPADSYQPGAVPSSFDKQFVRDYLVQIRWNKQPPVPPLPDEIVRKTAERYREAVSRLLEKHD